MGGRGICVWRRVACALVLWGCGALGLSVRAEPPAAADEAGLATLYTLHCSGCHGATGHGVPSAGIPDLHDAGAYVATPAGRAYLVSVPGLAQSALDDAAAARLLNYVLRQFSADQLPPNFRAYSVQEVSRLRGDVASDAVTRRGRILAELKARAKVPAGYGAGQ